MNPAVSVRGVSKMFRLFASPHHRLWEALHPLKKKYHREFWALRDISFEIPAGQTVGIIGRNGSGKSTLLSIVCSVLRPTTGQVRTNGRVSALLELGAGFNLQFTGRDNVLFYMARSGLRRIEADERLERIERFAEIGDFFDQPVRTYSSGMFVRLAFAAAIHVDPDILIVDEALAVGDARFQHKCYQKFLDFQQSGKTVLLVTHDINAIVKHCDQALLLEQGRLVKQGDPTQVANLYYELLLTGQVRAGESPEVPHASPMRERVVSSPVSSSPPEPASPTRARVVCDPATSSPAAPNGSSGYAEPPRGPHRRGLAIAGDAMPPGLEPFLKDTPGGRPKGANVTLDRCPERKTYNHNEHRYGDGRARIVDYLLVCGGQCDPVAAWSGDSIDIYLKALFQCRVEWPMFGFSLKTLDGIVVYATNTRYAELKIPPAAEGDCLLFRFSMALDVHPGDLFVDLGVAEKLVDLDAPLDVRRGLIHLHVRQREAFDGMANLHARLETLVTKTPSLVGRGHGS